MCSTLHFLAWTSSPSMSVFPFLGLILQNVLLTSCHQTKKRADAICFPQTLHWMSLRVTKTDTDWELKLEYFHSLIHHYRDWNSLLVCNRNQVHQDQLQFLWKTCEELTIKFSMIFDPESSIGKSNRQCTHRVSKNPVWGIMGGCQITWKKILIQRFGVGSIGNNKMLLVLSN